MNIRRPLLIFQTPPTRKVVSRRIGLRNRGAGEQASASRLLTVSTANVTFLKLHTYNTTIVPCQTRSQLPKLQRAMLQKAVSFQTIRRRKQAQVWGYIFLCLPQATRNAYRIHQEHCTTDRPSRKWPNPKLHT